MGFTWTIAVTGNAVVSYTAFPPLPVKQAVYFCCTILGVTSTRRYLASCPAKPGLSSSVCLSTMQPRPFTLLGSSWFYYMVTLPVFQPFFDFTDCFSGLIRFRSQFFNKYFFFSSNPNQTALFLIFS